MEHRLFIAIDLPGEIKDATRQALQADQKDHPELYEDARMMDEASWHITLSFLGNQSEIETIEQAIEHVAHQKEAPEITMQLLTTAPPQRPPRMVWITTSAETNKALGALKAAIEQQLAQNNIHPQEEHRPRYTGHITLARLPEGRRVAEHVVSFPHALSFRPKTIDLMESRLERTGAEYTLLKSIDFKPSV